MKFLCDVHISFRLVNLIRSKDFEVVHVNGILNSWNTTDEEIIRFADENDFVIISKDKDFKNSHLIRKKPKRLIKINLGNIPNNDLIEIFTQNFELILNLEKHDSFLLEINQDGINTLV